MAQYDTAVNFKPNMQEAMKMDRALKQSIFIEKKSAIDTVVRFAITVAQSAKARTKLGKRFRDIIQNPDWRPRSKIVRWVIVRRLQPSGERYLPKRKKPRGNDKRVIIANRGMAKDSWGWSLIRLNKSGGRIKTRGAHKFVRVTKNLRSTSPSVSIKILLTYILKVHPNIVRESFKAATNKVLKIQEKKLHKQLQRRLAKAA